MVKNKKGGSGHKRMARKHVTGGEFRQRRLREPEKDEMFACVTRVNGGNVFEVLCNDRVNRQMIVRKKFRGRNKRDNSISVGTMVLVGLRDWEVLSTKKKPKVDLLEVYNQNQMDQLKNVKSLNKEILPEQEVVYEDDGFMIDTDNIVIDKNIQEELNNNINKKLTMNKEKSEEKEETMEFDWDDI
jgi:translation initiation factor IF-1